MSEDFECDCPRVECESGGGWVTTFADLMSLLMCFFVLLLSFSEMDVQKFKQIAGSMKEAFGVQREVKASDIPLGTSIIAQEFSPGKPEPTPVPEVKQTTAKEDMSLEDAQQKLEDLAKSEADELRDKMQKEVDEGLIEVDSMQDKVVIRIKEKGSFPSGSANMHNAFLPILGRIREQIATTPGTITVAGHTDDVPINTFRFHSNWELSSARAASVVEELLKNGEIKSSDVEVKGLADTRPMFPNDSAEHRAANRRVEIVITPSMTTTTIEKSMADDQELPPPVEKKPLVVKPEQPEVVKPKAVSPVEEPVAEKQTEVEKKSAEVKPVVIQDDTEQPSLQPELTKEIQDLFGNINGQ